MSDEGSWEGTTLREVVELAPKPYREDSEAGFEIEGPSVELAPKTALAFALALHELTTNAIKTVRSHFRAEPFGLGGRSARIMRNLACALRGSSRGNSGVDGN